MILCQKGVCWTIDKDHYIKVFKQFAGQLWLYTACQRNPS